ncbi:MAG: AMIN domain-containing protein [Campylobacteraceae bacterium]|nr:AMIN domain-containing protein [Campylobacteraceae bacterium]
MNKFVWLFLCIAILLNARENPFETTSSPAFVGKTTQLKENKTDFNSMTLNLPSTARILKSVSIAFQNLDGSISEEVVAIEQNVNWHEPLILSTKKVDNKMSKEVTAIALPLEKPKEKKIGNVMLDKEEKPQMQSKIDTSFKLGDGVVLDIINNEMKITTKDTKIRDFLISEPFKIVVDFKKEGSFVTKTVAFPNPPFVSATLGNHDGFYRIAILLDGHYRYDLQSAEGGYIIKLK